MKSVSISDAKNGLSALIDKVKRGVSVVIVDRGRPVARLEPIGRTATGDQRIQQLIRDGLVRPPLAAFPKALIATPPPAPRPGLTTLDALLEERRGGR